MIFEKYEIAPGFMGQPEFEVPMPKYPDGPPERRARELYQLPRIFYSCVPAQTGKKTLCIKLQKNRPVLERI